MSKDIEAQVRFAMYKRGMKQKTLAQMLEISEAYLSDIIRGKADGPKAQEKIELIKVILSIK